MISELNATAFALFLPIGVLVCLEIGRRLGVRASVGGEIKGAGALEGATFALLGLLIAFTFSGAATRFEARRHLITEEVNAIGTAWLRIDVIPVEAQPAMRELFIQYMENRATVYRDNKDRQSLEKKMAVTAELQQKIWNAAIVATSREDARNQAAMLFLPALNAILTSSIRVRDSSGLTTRINRSFSCWKVSVHVSDREHFFPHSTREKSFVKNLLL